MRAPINIDAAAVDVRAALDVLERAGGDWQCGAGISDSGPLYWPAAIGHARGALLSALAALGEPQRLEAFRVRLLERQRETRS